MGGLGGSKLVWQETPVRAGMKPGEAGLTEGLAEVRKGGRGQRGPESGDPVEAGRA